MASGAPDYYNRTLTNITAQDIGDIAVDVAAQSLENVSVDIVAQTLTNMGVDIKASSIGNVPVNLNANSIGNLPVNLNANSIGNIPIDLNAQSIGNLGIDLAAQTGSDINIDINSQSIGEIINRPTYGGCGLLDYTTNFPSSGLITLGNLSGTGMIYKLFVAVGCPNSHVADTISVGIDGVTPYSFTWTFLNLIGMNNLTNDFATLVRYDTTNHVYNCVISGNITFESSLVIQYNNTINDGTSCYMRCIYGYI